MTTLSATVQDSYFVFGALIDESSGITTDYIAVPGGGSLISIIHTVQEEVATADITLTLSTVTAAGVATAVTGGTVTVPFAGTTIGYTVETPFTVTDGTDIIPAGGSLKIVGSGSSTTGILRVGAIIRRK